MSVDRVAIQDPASAAYVRGFFGWDDLLSDNLRAMPIETGTCSVILPAGESIENIDQLEWERPSLRGQFWEVKDFVVRFLAEHVAASPNSIALLATAAQEGDRRFSTPYVLVPTESGDRARAWLYIDHTSDTDAIGVAVRESRPFTSLWILTSTPGSLRLSSGARIGEESTLALARRTEHIVVTAFDGMSYLIWEVLLCYKRDLPQKGQ